MSTTETEFGGSDTEVEKTSINELRAAMGGGEGSFLANLGDLADDPARYIQPGTAPVVLGVPSLSRARIAGKDLMARFTFVEPAPRLRYVSRGHNTTRDDRGYHTFNAMLTNVNAKVEYQLDGIWYTPSELLAVLSNRYDGATWRQILSQFGIRVEGEAQERSAQSLSLQLLAASPEQIEAFWSLAKTKWGGVEEAIRAPRNERTDRRGQLDMGMRFGTGNIPEPEIVGLEIGTTDRTQSRAYRENPATGGVGFTTLPQQVMENIQRVLGARRAVALLESKAEDIKSSIENASRAMSAASDDRARESAREALDTLQDDLADNSDEIKDALRMARSWATHLGGAQPGYEFNPGEENPEDAAVPTGEYYATPAPCGRYSVRGVDGEIHEFNFWTRRDQARTETTAPQRDEAEVIRVTQPSSTDENEPFGEVPFGDTGDAVSAENRTEVTEEPDLLVTPTDEDLDPGSTDHIHEDATVETRLDDGIEEAEEDGED